MTPHAPLILDVAGLTLTDVDRRRLAHPLTGGMILFGRNWQDRGQLEALCRDIRAVREDLLICVDHEGGRVQRFRTGGFTHLPPMRVLGDLWMEDAMAATNAATAAGYVLGAELRACGVDFSFTPVLDLDWQDEAPTHAQAPPAPRAGSGSVGRPGASRSGIIGDRSFHRDPRVAALLAKSLMHGLLRAGMANCGKHFPGHGFVKADSHTEVPVDRRSLKAILADDAAPYQWLNTSLSSVMPAHVVYPKVDNRPAGFSTRWLNDVLRAQLGFRGAIFSDDLSMAGARLIDGHEVSYTGAAVAALDAGCDMVLLCNQSVQDPAAVDELLEGLADAQRRGLWQAREASEQRRLALLPATPAHDWDALMAHPDYIHALDLLP
jgi:beta-N-acetylhexosaminidase